MAGVRHRRARAVDARPTRRPDGARVAILPSSAQEAAYVAHALRTAAPRAGRPVGPDGRRRPVRRPGRRPAARARRRRRSPSRCWAATCRCARSRPSGPCSLAAALRPGPLDARRGGGDRPRSPRRTGVRTRSASAASGGRCARRSWRAGAAAPATRCSSRCWRTRPAPRRCRPRSGAGRGGSRRCSPPAGWPGSSPPRPRRPSCGPCGPPPTSRSRGAGRRSRAGRLARGPTATWTRSSPSSGRPRPSSTGCRRRRRSRSSTTSSPRTSRRTASPPAGPADPPSRCSRRPGPRAASGTSSWWPACRTARGPTCGCGTPCSGPRVWSTLLAGRAADGQVAGAEARAAVLADELRSFAVATSRARRTLLVTAVADADQQPSPFVDLVQPPDAPDAAAGDDSDPRLATAPAPLDLRGLVGSLRARLEASVARPGGAVDREAAALLARLAAGGRRGRGPGRLVRAGCRSRTDAPLWTPDEKVPVSPSKAETVSTCALRWALEAAGGTVADGASQTLGHARPRRRRGAAAGHRGGAARRARPALAGARPAARVAGDRRAPSRGADDRRVSPATSPLPARPCCGRRRSASSWTAPCCAGWSTGWRTSATASSRSSTSRPASAAPSTTGTDTNPQLGGYQLAVTEGAFEGLPPGTRTAGAQLVFVALGQKATVRAQGALQVAEDGSSWARAMVDGVAATMAASAFTACANDLCEMCPVRTSCPVRAEGRQVTE